MGVRGYGILNWIGVDCGLWKAINGALKIRAHPTVIIIYRLGGVGRLLIIARLKWWVGARRANPPYDWFICGLKDKGYDTNFYSMRDVMVSRALRGT
jgi:hypothetical protein